MDNLIVSFKLEVLTWKTAGAFWTCILVIKIFVYEKLRLRVVVAFVFAAPRNQAAKARHSGPLRHARTRVKTTRTTETTVTNKLRFVDLTCILVSGLFVLHTLSVAEQYNWTLFCCNHKFTFFLPVSFWY